MGCWQKLNVKNYSKENNLFWEAIFFDFDGVILDSVDVKTQAFALLFRPYGRKTEEAVVRYHLENGGISRYDKFKYYYEKLLKTPASEKKLSELGKRFSELVVNKVISSPFIPGALETLIKLHEHNVPTFVVSGTPEQEIKKIIQKKGISKYFQEVHGSPRTKTNIVSEIIKRKSLTASKCLFLGDSLSDYFAAQDNGLHFLGIINDSENSIFPKGTNISPQVCIDIAGENYEF